MKKVFLSYSHRDEDFKDELKKHLIPLVRMQEIEIWDDRDIQAGDYWDDEINNALESADIVLLLISTDFIASTYCYEKELERSMERVKEGTCRVIPVIIRTCKWERLPLGKLQALPKNGKAISEWANRDVAYTYVAQKVYEVVDQ
ncbi:MAG: toll/interleukin-1 receptor domain-containing protein [Bacteroidota bacterium]